MSTKDPAVSNRASPNASLTPSLLLGIFVGGAARRMGGYPKGLLSVPGSDEPIVCKLVRVGRAAGLTPVFVGDATPYLGVVTDVPVIADDPEREGPLAGLTALLEYAGDSPVVTVACDMPFASEALLSRLKSLVSDAPIVAHKRGRGEDAPFEPFLARYDSSQVLPVLRERLHAGARSFQDLFRACTVALLEAEEPDDARAWHDWDTPEDAAR